MTSMFNRRRFLAAGAAAAGALAAPALVSAQGSREKIVIGTVPVGSLGCVFLPMHYGWFTDAGLDVEIVPFQASAPISTAVVSGDIDIGITGLTAAFYNTAGAGNLKLIAGQQREQQGYQTSAYMATEKAWDEGLRTFPDFAGRRVGLSTLGSTFHYSILLACHRHNVDVNEINLVPLQSNANMIAAFRSGQIDAMNAPLNAYRQLESEGVGKLVGRVGDVSGSWQLGGVFADPDKAASRRAAFETFLDVFRKGCAAYHETFNNLDADGGVIQGENFEDYLAVIADTLQQKPEVVLNGLPFVHPQAELDVADVELQIANWQAAGLVGGNVKLSDAVDESFVN